MESSGTRQEWILFIHQLPPKPTSLRVGTWRKLQRLGAVAIKNSVYVLPYGEKTHEDFQWLRQEVESAGGEATVFRAGSVEGTTDRDIVASFRRDRDEAYSRLAAEFDALTGAIRERRRGGRLSVGRVAAHEAELNRLHQELERVVSTDFFGAKNRAAAQAAYDKCLKALHTSQHRGAKSPGPGASDGGRFDPAQYQGRRWVTRRDMHIDRAASAWFIGRFIDARPRFHFVADGETIEGGVAFDMVGAEFTHVGEDCTFETMVKRFGLAGDEALREIAEIVHDIDLKDNKFNRLEAPGVDAVVRGLGLSLKDDKKLLRQAGAVFDGLYDLLAARGGKKKGEKRGSRKSGRSGKSAGRSKRG